MQQMPEQEGVEVRLPQQANIRSQSAIRAAENAALKRSAEKEAQHGRQDYRSPSLDVGGEAGRERGREELRLGLSQDFQDYEFQGSLQAEEAEQQQQEELVELEDP